MNKNLSAYSAIADLYEALMEVDYDIWAQYVIEKIKKHAPSLSGADVGCGSGAFTRRMKASGLAVYGVDVSREMLDRAVELNAVNGLSIQYLQQDMRAFKSMGRLGFITALTDCFNYVSAEDFKKTLKRFHSSLEKGGLLLFDVSSQHKLFNVIGDNMFGEDGEDFTYVWFNKRHVDGVQMDISLFRKTPNGMYKKTEESHFQYAHSEEFIKQALEQCGFEIIAVEGHLGEELTEASQRINFIAKRK